MVDKVLKSANGAVQASFQDEAAGGGDMYKATYDTDNDGVVDNSEQLEGATKAQVQDHTPKAHTIASHSDTTATGAQLNELVGGGQTVLHSHAGAGGGALPTPVCITLVAVQSFTWTNMPVALTEFMGDAYARTEVDLTSAAQSRVTVRIRATAPKANAKIIIQYSTDESAWTNLCSVTMPATANKTNVGTWTDVPAGAKADVFIRIAGQDGDGVIDPNFSLITLQVK
jgi:hypothetical protein